MKKYLLFALAALTIAACGKCDAPANSSGKPAATVAAKDIQPAPDMHLSKLLQADRPELKSLSELKGKVLVLEFWGSWCEPCVQNIPHFNELAEKMKDKPVQFIAITDEDSEDVERFLKKTPIKGWIGIDTDKSAFKAFRIRGRPNTIIIDAKGNLVLKTYPSRISVEGLDAIIAGKLDAIPQADPASVTPDKGGAHSLIEARIARSETKTGTSSSVSQCEITAHNVTIAWMLGEAYHIPANRVKLARALDGQGNYDVSIRLPYDASDRFQAFAQQTMNIALGVKARIERQQCDVLLLKKVKAAAPGINKAAPGSKISSTYGMGKIVATSQDFSSFSRSLEMILATPIIDETGLKGPYDYSLTWNSTDKEGLKKSLATQLGMELVPARRSIDVLAVANERNAGMTGISTRTRH